MRKITMQSCFHLAWKKRESGIMDLHLKEKSIDWKGMKK